MNDLKSFAGEASTLVNRAVQVGQQSFCI